MDVFDTVRTLLAVRRYADKPVPEEIVRRIVEAGRLTASSINKQPWHFVVVEDRDTLRRLAEVARTGPYIPNAPSRSPSSSTRQTSGPSPMGAGRSSR